MSLRFRPRLELDMVKKMAMAEGGWVVFSAVMKASHIKAIGMVPGVPEWDLIHHRSNRSPVAENKPRLDIGRDPRTMRIFRFMAPETVISLKMPFCSSTPSPRSLCHMVRRKPCDGKAITRRRGVGELDLLYIGAPTIDPLSKIGNFQKYLLIEPK